MSMHGPRLAEIAHLMGDPARANMLQSLMDGRALTAKELAYVAGVAPQTASGHLAKLMQGGLLGVAAQGRHRYYRLAGPEVAAGQTLWFHSRTPHRSGANTSTTARRALYPTYNARSEGDLREDYYREKLAAFAADDGSGAHTKVSLIGDFQGRAVDTGTAAV